ncbi:MAG: hypothetical protein H7839_13520 [Magnetococcus sp. YQC-5]
MNLGELITAARNRLDDKVDPFLWDTSELTQYINTGIIEACVRSELILDARTPAVCKIDLQAGQGEYNLHPKVLFIKSATIGTAPRTKIYKATTPLLFANCYDFPTGTGVPNYYLLDVGNGRVGVYPIPEANDEMWFYVSRLPLLPLSDQASTPEIQEPYHFGLINWVCHEAYLKEDAETKDETKAMKYLSLFELQFGQRKTAQEIIQQTQYATSPFSRRSVRG